LAETAVVVKAEGGIQETIASAENANMLGNPPPETLVIVALCICLD
jgi:hypothetical protein